MAYNANVTIDSFKFLWRQIEDEIRGVFNDSRDVLAVIGSLYVSRKVFKVVVNVVDTFRVHCFSNASISFPERYGPWAVITGSSEGIGRAYAHELALRGLNVVLISRSERKLMQAKADIEADCKVKVEYIVADFASENQTELYDNIAEKLADKEVGLLVNNVGVMYDFPDVLLNIPKYKLWQLIYVNIGAATMMTHMLLPDMVKRNKGGIVVVSSGSSTQITPQMTVYSATKRYLDYFTHGIAYEYRHTDITFQCLIPFYTATRMTGYSDRLSKTSFMVPNAANYAKSAVKTLGRSQCTTGYFPHMLQLWIANALPLGFWMWASEKLNNSLRKEAQNRRAKRTSRGAFGDQSDEQ